MIEVKVIFQKTRKYLFDSTSAISKECNKIYNVKKLRSRVDNKKQKASKCNLNPIKYRKK